MTLTRSQKEKVVQELGTEFSEQKSLVFVDFQGLKVGEIEQIKKNFKEHGISFKVYKKTLIRRVLKAVNLDVPIEEFTGSVGLVIDKSSEIEAAKQAYLAAQKFGAFKMLGGLFDSQFAPLAQVNELALVPSREELLAKLLAVLQGPIRGFVTVLDGVPSGFVRVLHERANQG